MPIWIIVCLVLIAAIWIAASFNRMVSLGKRADGSWSDIDVQLKRRWDLVPALVETVRGYARHESATLEQVVQARTAAAQPAGIDQRGERERSLSEAVSGLFALAEAYPDLKANEGFQQLHRSLVEVEESLQQARRYYNAVIRDYNTLIQRFPDMLVAIITGFRERQYFQIDDSHRAAPKIQFDQPSTASDAADPRKLSS